MNDGYFIGKGDKTTCGGEVLDGDPRINILGLLHACAGDRVTCGVDGETYQIVGGISHMESHGRLMAGTLDSRSDCPCRARLIPSEFTASYRNESTAPQAIRRTAQPAHATATNPSIAPRQSAFVPSGNAVPPVFNRLEPQEPGFYVAPKSMTREALEATLFPTANPAVMSKFRALNPNLSEVKAGSLVVLSDPTNTSCTYQEAQLMQAAQQVKASLEPLTSDEADFAFLHAAEIAGYIEDFSTGLGISAAVMETHLTRLRDTLQAMERLHQESYRQHGHLKSPQFFAERKRLMAQLDAHLLKSTRLRGQITLSDHPKLKTALGISSRSLVHHWNKAGGPGQIPGYASHVEATSRAAKYMKAGGYIGIGISGVSSLLAVQEVCRGDSGAACEKIRFTEGGKFGGSTFGGAIAGGIAGSVGGSVCTALGFATGIGGVICVAAIVGTGTWGGTKVGELGGERLGEKLYEKILP
ncbi:MULTISPECIES: PAAR domain-containing protein [unclassified Pseudomonas]|uniref:PAAR domain-containing protein n=1 Tax=unclassified Pseudomonas TaxID=196821 RepID=UPI0015A02FEE|nr:MULTISPECIES: PAAR domain-containing protein [unclassified Pseudomonas]NWC95034.1 PAAR domain-containing protein [Pseudomonas sp. IPO3779]NWD18306.1 PAAR domain-containing protein [Pseudomonas sp. IPO3778]